MQRLPPALRRLIIAHYLHELSISELAAVEGISVEEISRRLYRGRQFLRRWLTDQGENAETLLAGLDRRHACWFATENGREPHCKDQDEK